MLILGTFAFLTEAEERVSAAAQKELSEWASLLPVNPNHQKLDSTDQSSQSVTMLYSLLSEEEKKVNLLDN